MARLMVMRKGVKTRYASNGRGHCEACGDPIQVGDSYTRTGGGSNGKKRRLY
ncbi:unnamed protein product, partial [marine sediment metagenome]